MIKTMEDKPLEFLWGTGKRHGIAKGMIKNSRQNFGLKFPCLSTKDESLKVAWVKRILDNEESSISPFLARNMNINLHMFFRCNLKETDLYSSWRQKPSTFWQNVLSTWCKTNYRLAHEVEVPDEEILWFNSNIRVNGNVLFYENVYRNGVQRVCDLKKNDGNFLNFGEFNIKYLNSGIHFLQYHGLIGAMPENYKKNQKGVNSKKSAFDSLLSVQKVPKKYYNLSIEKFKIFPIKAYEKHSRFLTDLQIDRFNESFEIMYSCTRSTKLKDFQFRLLHMTLVTNKEAYHYFKKVPSDRCTFCKNRQEDIHHILLHCRYTRDLWTNFQAYIERKTGVNIAISDTDIILGNKLLPFPNLYNHLIILTKQYLYACRCLNDIPDFNALLRKIDREYRIELTTYSNENFQVDPNRKWDPIYPP